MSEPISVNGNEVYVRVAERAHGLRVGFDLDEWRGLRLHKGKRVPIRRPEKADVWLYVAQVTEVPPSCWVVFDERFDGEAEEPPPRVRPMPRLAPAPAEYRYKAEPELNEPPEPEPKSAATAAPADTHAKLLEVGREWLEKYKPKSRFGVFVNDEGDGVPMGRVTIRPDGGPSAA